MHIIISDNLDLVASAGKKIWMLGFTKGQTRILNPIEVFLFVERYTDNSRERLTLVRVSASGNIIPVLELDHSDEPKDDGTIVFLAENESALFLIPEVIEIQSILSDIVSSALDYRIDNCYNQESLFFDIGEK